jgi:NTP pyrophosphatase (non-canonical NTP hydrolase)
MISITQLQRDQFIWARKNFGPCQTRWPLLGIVEETGELVHSQLKQEQNIRGSYEEHEAKKKDAIGDLTIYLFEYCSCMEWTVVDLLVEEETTLHALQEHTEDSEPVWDCLGKIVPLVHDKNNNGDNVLAQEDVVQILLNLAIFCRQRAWSLQELVETTWLRVSQRDWTKNKTDGGDTVDEDDKKLGEYLAFLKSDKGKAALRRQILVEVERWSADPDYVAALPPVVPIPVTADRLLFVTFDKEDPLMPGLELLVLRSDDPHAPSALYGYAESVDMGPNLENGDPQRAQEIRTSADHWCALQSQTPRAPIKIALKTDGTRTGRFDASRPNPSASPREDLADRFEPLTSGRLDSSKPNLSNQQAGAEESEVCVPGSSLYKVGSPNPIPGVRTRDHFEGFSMGTKVDEIAGKERTMLRDINSPTLAAFNLDGVKKLELTTAAPCDLCGSVHALQGCDLPVKPRTPT